ncbi:hypothetical protein [uncultured Algimonas sp.]|uniref:hypothetical protein n=1 Tax=uncultured Algimonas sp. TaxID=1547920 RepID=UPI0026308E88|nr:hypothetical protein [uncultured Algimonas sp.]
MLKNKTVNDFDGASDADIANHIASSARELSDMAMSAGKAEAAALLVVVAGMLSEGPDAD